MLKQAKNPYGYRNLLVYKKVEEVQRHCAEITGQFPKTKTLIALADQMDRSAHSTKQNIVEGWKRNSTGEYYQFLGFSIGSNTELEEDCNDIINGVYRELMRIKGVMGTRGMGLDDVEKLPFYPIPEGLPPIAELKLKTKEINFLLERLKQSLSSKMSHDGTLSVWDKLRRAADRRKQADQEWEDFITSQGLVTLENWQVIKKKEWERMSEDEKRLKGGLA